MRIGWLAGKGDLQLSGPLIRHTPGLSRPVGRRAADPRVQGRHRGAQQRRLDPVRLDSAAQRTTRGELRASPDRVPRTPGEPELEPLTFRCPGTLQLRLERLLPLLTRLVTVDAEGTVRSR
jgi:hypothetical protein